MAEIRTVTTLRSKRDEIVSSIRLYERQLEQSRSDLAHINAVIRVFEATGDPKEMPRYVDIHRLFKRHELWKLALKSLAGGAELSTKEIAFRVMAAKGFDTSDSVLGIAMAQKLAQALKRLSNRGQLVLVGKRKGMCVWRLFRENPVERS